MKKILALLLAGIMTAGCAAVLGGCNKTDTDPSGSAETQESSDEAGASESEPESEDGTKPELTEEDWAAIAEEYPADIKHDEEHEVGYQLEKPASGDEIAVIHTNKGDITLRLFPENAPNTVENFVGLAKRGDYDGVPFHRVIDGFMIQGGDTTNGDGTGGTTFSGGILYDEFCDKLFNIRGSVSMANSGRDTNSSQFFINQAKPEDLKSWDEYKSSWEYMKEGIREYYGEDSFIAFAAYYGSSCFNPDLMSDEVKALYEANGGNPSLDGIFNVFDRGHTVFAQVIEGMDVVDTIAASETDDNDRPVDDVTIKSIEIKTY